ncbi:MAG: hypothetical protein FJY92_12760 [Candidatus Hydrogenedentes bacterium]|nr:hypothetical protein [Candidatus Hydrogenedentota bacterium]
MTAQGVIVAMVVGACAVYLARRWYRMIAGRSTGCGCGDCPRHSATTPSVPVFNPESRIQNPK